MGIPDQISWTKEPTETGQNYRGSTNVQSQFLQNDGLNFKSSQFMKHASNEMNAYSIPNDISGNAIDISFIDGNNGIKSSFPTINSMQNNSKPKEPLIQIEVTPNNDNDINDNNNLIAPLYDGFQPHYAHYSNMDPTKLIVVCQSILNELVNDGFIDFCQRSPFVFTGRTYGDNDDAEFLLNIFANNNNDSVIELRRSCGESFNYAKVERNIIGKLKKNKIIGPNKDMDDESDTNDEFDNNHNNHNNNNDDEDDDGSSLSGFQFGMPLDFDSLPSLESMDIDMVNFNVNDDDDNDINDDDEKTTKFNPNEMNENEAIQMVQNAVDLESMRDVFRCDIAYLNEQISKHHDIFRQIPDIIGTIIGVINDDFYDCWAIKTYLGMINKLISFNATVPSNLLQSMQNIKLKWSHTVINEVAPNVQFEFYPSQQIVRCCDQIINQLNQNE